MKPLLLLLLLLISCSPSYISPHTKAGQAKIQDFTINTPYYVQLQTTDAIVPFKIHWDGRAEHMIIDVEFIIRPTSPRIGFTVYQPNLMGNSYRVYRDHYNVNLTESFEGSFSIHQRGDYRVRTTLVNKYHSVSRTSYFKVD